MLPEGILLEILRRERLSFLQYVSQTSPYAAPADKPVLGRIREMARTETEGLDGLADYLERHHVTVSPPGAFPSVFTNYNFVAVRKLLPHLAQDEARGLAELEREINVLPVGEARSYVEKLADSKRVHVTELEKLIG
jgi:hypothetical protein